MFPLYMENKKHDNEHIFYHDPFAKTRAMPNAEKHDETCYAWSREKAWSRPKKKNLPLLTCFSFVLQRTRICTHPRVSLCPSVTLCLLYFFIPRKCSVFFTHQASWLFLLGLFHTWQTWCRAKAAAKLLIGSWNEKGLGAVVFVVGAITAARNTSRTTSNYLSACGHWAIFFFSLAL